MTSVSHQGFLGWGGGLGAGGMYFAYGRVIWNEGDQGTNRPKNGGGGVASKKLHWKKKLKSP